LLPLSSSAASPSCTTAGWRGVTIRGSSQRWYFVTWGDVPIITLHYRWQGEEDVRIPVRLQWTATHFNGHRWWFICPLIVGGVPCNRRVGKLYLPPGARYFGCRQCHDLAYRSCQEAHRTERLFGSMERRWGCDALCDWGGAGGTTLTARGISNLQPRARVVVRVQRPTSRWQSTATTGHGGTGDSAEH
jgi:hypothetical protein